MGDRLVFVGRNELRDSEFAGSAASLFGVRDHHVVQEDHLSRDSWRRSVGRVGRLGPVEGRVGDVVQLEWHAHFSGEVSRWQQVTVRN